MDTVGKHTYSRSAKLKEYYARPARSVTIYFIYAPLRSILELGFPITVGPYQAKTLIHSVRRTAITKGAIALKPKIPSSLVREVRNISCRARVWQRE